MRIIIFVYFFIFLSFALYTHQQANASMSATTETKPITIADEVDPTAEEPTIENIIEAYEETAVDKSDLFIRSVPILDVAAAKTISQAIAKTDALRRFVLTKNGVKKQDKDDLSGHVLKDEVVDELINNGIAKQGKVRVLGITKNSFESAKSCATLGSYLSNSDNSVEKLYLYRNLFKPTDVECIKQLSQAFTQRNNGNTTKLFKLVIIDNDLGDAGLDYVIQLIESPNANITELILRNVGMTPQGAAKLAASLATPKNKLLKLDISENAQIGDSGFKTLFESIAQSGLTHLEIANSGLTSQDVINALGDLIIKSKDLQKVDVSDNKIGDEGAKAFVKIIEQNPALLKLDLSSTGLSDAGITAIIEALEKNNTNLSRLNLFRQEVVSEDLQKRLVMLDKVVKSDYFEQIEDEDEYSEDDEDEDDEDSEYEEEEEEEEEMNEEEIKAHNFFKKKQNQAQETPKHDEL